MLAEKLLRNQVTDKEHLEKILRFLCSESGSHDYTINRKEAKDELGLKVSNPTDDQYTIIKKLYDDFSSELKLTESYNPDVFMGTDQNKSYSFRRGLIESCSYGSHVLLSEGQLKRVPIPGPGQAGTKLDQTTSHEGWKHEK